MSKIGIEMEGRSFAPEPKLPKSGIEMRIPVAGELEGIFRGEIDKIVENKAIDRRMKLGSFNYWEPIMSIRPPEEKNLILKEKRDRVMEILFSVMQKYGLHPDRFSLKTHKHCIDPGRLWGSPYNIEEIRRYPTNYKNVFFESRTGIKKTGELFWVTWYGVNKSFRIGGIRF